MLAKLVCRLGILLSLTAACGLTAAERADVAALVERLKKTGEGTSPFQEHITIAKQLQARCGEAIPHLLPLLADDHGAVRYVVSIALADCDELTDEHLDTLIAAYRRGEIANSLPLAIANVGSARAIEFLVEELLHTRNAGNSNVEAGVRRLGEKAVPSLVRIYATHGEWDTPLELSMFSVLEGLSSKADSAIEPLLRLANNEDAPDAKRFRAAKALGAIGPAALLRLLETDSHFITDIPSAEHTGDPYTTNRLLAAIAALRERGRSAGPVVIKLLESKDWEVRIEAARTLGRIGCNEASAELIKLLKRADDWRLVYSAAESLGLLQSKEAIPELTELNRRHWDLPVREVAMEAITAIRAGTSYKPKDSSAAYDFFDEGVGRDIDSLGEEYADKLRLATLPPPAQLEIKIKDDDGEVRSEKRTGIQVEGGYLVGTDLGEFGGEIAFIDEEGNSQVLAQEHTQTIYKTTGGIFSVGGLAHMDFNTGYIFKVERADDDRQWSVRKWRALPGAPRFSRLLENGSFFVSCHGAMVLVSPEGEMRSITRSECLRASER